MDEDDDWGDDGDWGDGDDDGMDQEEFFMDDNEWIEEPVFERRETSEVLKHNKNFKVDIYDQKMLKAQFTEKVSTLQKDFTGSCNFETGVYWRALRERGFQVEQAKTFIGDKMFDILETKSLREIKSGDSDCCMVCTDEYLPHQLFHAGCGHRFCEECFSYHIDEKIKQGPACIWMECPQQKCKFSIWDDLISRILGTNAKSYEKYLKYMMDDFVKESPNMLFCPGPDCVLAIGVQEKMLTKSNKLPLKDVFCSCDTIVCLRCGLMGHEPLSCDAFKEWEDSLENKKDKLSGFWMKKNTKKCPKCSVNIEKNQGCMHMTCVTCKHDFCWLCLGEWKKHGSSTGGYYKCNIYKEDANEADKKTNEERDMKKLEFYLDRFNEHRKSFKQNNEDLLEFKKKVYDISSKKELAILNKQVPGSLDFYHEALKFVARGRNFISFTYPQALQIVNLNELALFGETQYQLEHALEALNKSLEENPVENFVTKTNLGVFQCEDYAKMKKNIMDLKNILSNQFGNAEREYESKDFLCKIKTSVGVPVPAKVKEVKPKGKAAKKKTTEVLDWYCTQCTFYNQNNRTTQCTICNSNGRPPNQSKII